MAEGLVSAVTALHVLGVVVLGFSSTVNAVADITAVVPVEVTAVTTAVLTIAASKSAVLQVPFEDNIFLASLRGITFV